MPWRTVVLINFITYYYGREFFLFWSCPVAIQAEKNQHISTSGAQAGMLDSARFLRYLENIHGLARPNLRNAGRGAFLRKE